MKAQEGSKSSGVRKALHIANRRNEFASLKQKKEESTSVGRSIRTMATSFRDTVAMSYRRRKSTFSAAMAANASARRARFESYAQSRFHQQVLLGDTPEHEINSASFISFEPTYTAAEPSQLNQSFKWDSQSSVIKTGENV